MYHQDSGLIATHQDIWMMSRKDLYGHREKHIRDLATFQSTYYPRCLKFHQLHSQANMRRKSSRQKGMIDDYVMRTLTLPTMYTDLCACKCHLFPYIQSHKRHN
jgi:hypothetical protein